MSTEVAVVGGGPTGLICALCLSRLGHEVVAIDYGRRRPGWVELVSPEAVLALCRTICSPRLLQASGRPCRGVVDAWQDRAVQFQDFELMQCCNGWVIRRELFDANLRRFAERNGVCVLSTAKPAKLQGASDQTHLELVLSDRVLRASFLIDATGASSGLLPPDFCRRLRFDRLIALGLALPSAPDNLDTLRLAASSVGWWYTLQLDNKGTFAVFLTDGDLLPKQPLAVQRFLQQQFHEAFGDTDDLSLDALRSFLRRDARTGCAQRLWRGRWLRIGDAAFTVDPIAGRGLTESFQAAETAATCVSEFLRSGHLDCVQEFAIQNLVRFAETLDRLRQVYAGRTGAFTGLAHPFWRRRADANAFRVPISH
jgi:2-polyprenyl-6-methoxyphenol hydroxylase-like FAD-dependent oxidoreductase